MKQFYSLSCSFPLGIIITLKYTGGRRQCGSLDSILCMKPSASHHQFLCEHWTEIVSKVTVSMKQKAPTHVKETGILSRKRLLSFYDSTRNVF